MLTSVLIAKKRDGKELSKEEIQFLIQGYAQGEIPDYQMSAWAMAVYLQGMSEQEIEALTLAMLRSGDVLASCSDRPRVDKHSTGGLGDKTSLILAPLLALFDLDVPMLSGRGLGITGGTLDKLESIPGFRTNLNETEIAACLKQIGCVITGASQSLVPADRKLYALRDVTATVPSIPLITGSIMSKKLAESLNALVLDVKWGSGAFMQERSQAIALARSLVNIGNLMGVPTEALLTDMNQPLGRMVGNACEVNESLDILENKGPHDAQELTIELTARLLVATARFSNLSQARSAIEQKLQDGSALERFYQMVRLQGGDLSGPLPLAQVFEWKVERSGICQSMDGQLLGQAVIELGGGRRIAADKVDPSVGFETLVRVGDAVQAGDVAFRVFARDAASFQNCAALLRQAVVIGEAPTEAPRLWEALSFEPTSVAPTTSGKDA